MKMMDCIEIITEKEKYIKNSVHKGMQGWICLNDCTNGYWLVNFPQCGEKDDIAEVSINEKDMRVIPSLNAIVNEKIREMLTDKSKKYILDFSDCKYLGEIHQRIQTVLELPDWYGQNLDALWDAITGIMYLPAEITIIFQPQTTQALQLLDEVDKIIAVFAKAANEFGEIVLNIVK